MSGGGIIMTMINMFEAKTDLSRLVKQLEDNEEDLFVICRSGKPVAHLVRPARKPRFAARESAGDMETEGLPILVMSQEEFDSMNGEIAEMFGV